MGLKSWMTRWTHNLCQQCWDGTHPGGEKPFSKLKNTEDHCCICGKLNRDGIYYKWNPKEMPCGGKHSS